MSKVTKISTDYELSDGENKIFVSVFDGHITITPGNNKHERFKFAKSKPEKIRAIAKLLEEASRLEGN